MLNLLGHTPVEVLVWSMLERSRPWISKPWISLDFQPPRSEFQTFALTMLFLAGASPQKAFDGVTRYLKDPTLNLMDFRKEQIASEVDAAIMSALKMVKELRAVHSSLNDALFAAQHRNRIGELASDVLGNRDLSTLIHSFADDRFVSTLLGKNDEHFWSQLEKCKPPERGFRVTCWLGMIKSFLPIPKISDRRESRNE